jgi:hypothetical protein
VLRRPLIDWSSTSRIRAMLSIRQLGESSTSRIHDTTRAVSAASAPEPRTTNSYRPVLEFVENDTDSDRTCWRSSSAICS